MSNNESASSDRSIFFQCRMGILHITLSKGTCWKLGLPQHGISHHTWEQLDSLTVQRPQSLSNRNEADTRHFTFSVLQICLFRKRTRKQHSLTVSWFFLKQLTCLASIGSLVRQDLRRSLVQPPDWGLVIVRPGQVAQSFIQSGLENLQGLPASLGTIFQNVCPNGGKAFVCNCSKPHLCCCNFCPLSITLLPRSALTSPAPSSHNLPTLAVWLGGLWLHSPSVIPSPSRTGPASSASPHQGGAAAHATSSLLLNLL